MKYCTVLQKAGIVAVSGLLLLGLFGCGGNKSETDPSDSQTQPDESQVTQETEVSYREYNFDDFKGMNQLSISLGSDEIRQSALKIYGMEGEACGRGVGELFKTVFSDLKDNSGIDLTYIDMVGYDKILGMKQFYYKVEVEDIEAFREHIEDHSLIGDRVDASNWTENDEIYLKCNIYPPDERILFYFKFKNYTVDETQPSVSAQTVQGSSSVEIIAANPLEKVIVETDYYTVEIPQEWDKYCTYDETTAKGEHRLTFRIKGNYMEGRYDSTLLELAAVENPKYLDEEQYSYICQICENKVMFYLMQWAPDDIQVQGQYQELLMNLQEFVPYVIQSIKETGGYTLSYEPMDEGGGIPYVSTASIDIIGKQFAPSGQYNALEYSSFVLSPYSLSEVDDVVYYWVDEGQPYRAYGVRNGLIVAYMDLADGYPEVHTALTDDFDGIAPEVVTRDYKKYLVWEVSNGYVIFDVVESGRGYLYDMIESFSYFTDKDMSLLLSGD